MERTRLYYDILEFVNSHLKPSFPAILGRAPVEVSKDVLMPQIMVSFGVLQDNRILVTFHVSTDEDKEEELKIMTDKLTQLIENESSISKYAMYDYGRTRVLHPVVDGRPFIQKLCHFAARPKLT